MLLGLSLGNRLGKRSRLLQAILGGEVAGDFAEGGLEVANRFAVACPLHGRYSLPHRIRVASIASRDVRLRMGRKCSDRLLKFVGRIRVAKRLHILQARSPMLVELATTNSFGLQRLLCIRQTLRGRDIAWVRTKGILIRSRGIKPASKSLSE